MHSLDSRSLAVGIVMVVRFCGEAHTLIHIGMHCDVVDTRLTCCLSGAEGDGIVVDGKVGVPCIRRCCHTVDVRLLATRVLPEQHTVCPDIWCAVGGERDTSSRSACRVIDDVGCENAGRVGCGVDILRGCRCRFFHV